MTREELKEQDIRLNKLCFDYYEKEKRITELKKENAELKTRNGELAGKVASLERWFGEAKKIIREYLGWADWESSNCPSFASICKKAEVFLKECKE